MTMCDYGRNFEADEILPGKRTAWARLIQKIYEVDPLTCPKCKGAFCNA